mgnify:FL=1
MNKNISIEELSSIVENNIGEVIEIIKEKFPNIDIYARHTTTPVEEIERIMKEVQSKYKGIKLFYSDIPYFGVIVYKQHTIRETREIASLAIEFTEKLIAEYGGKEEINNKPQKEKEEIETKIMDKTTDFMNFEILKRCVLYPYDFKEKLETEELPFGTAIILIDAISEVSGYQHFTIEEV